MHRPWDTRRFKSIYTILPIPGVKKEVLQQHEGLVLTVRETAAILRISRTLTYEGIKSGEIPSIKIGRRLLIPRSGLEHLPGQWAAGGAKHE